jgi:hypothetical protein
MNATPSGFSGTFYDGKSANKYPVKLRLTPQQLVLVFPDGHQIQWPYTALQLSRTNSTGPVRLERSTSNPDIIPEAIVIEDPRFLEEAHRVAPGALGNVWNQPHKAFNFCDLGIRHSGDDQCRGRSNSNKMGREVGARLFSNPI